MFKISNSNKSVVRLMDKSIEDIRYSDIPSDMQEGIVCIEDIYGNKKKLTPTDDGVVVWAHYVWNAYETPKKVYSEKADTQELDWVDVLSKGIDIHHNWWSIRADHKARDMMYYTGTHHAADYCSSVVDRLCRNCEGCGYCDRVHKAGGQFKIMVINRKG